MAFCLNCQRTFHKMGIMSHRRAHLRRGQECVIQFASGKRVRYLVPAYYQKPPVLPPTLPEEGR